MNKDESKKLLELISYFKIYIKDFETDINILTKKLKKYNTNNNNSNSYN